MGDAASKSKMSERIEHVVVLMLENRSFDHMLGGLPAVNGLFDGEGKPKGGHFNLSDPSDKGSDLYPAILGAPYAVPARDIPKNGYGGPSHSFPAATEQLFGDKVKPESQAGYQPEVLNGFIKSYESELRYSAHAKDPSRDEIGLPMAVFKPEQVPVISALAQHFVVCDQWYSEVPGPTEPNRLFMHTATSEGFTHNVWSRAINSTSIYKHLSDAGVEWGFYYYDLSDSNQLAWVKDQVDRVKPFDTFYEDVKSSETLPGYTFLCPRYVNTKDARANSEHAPEDVRYGEFLIADVYEAIRNSPVWNKTLFVLLYDEHGGFYDHVLPPQRGVDAPDAFTSPTAYDKQQAERSSRNEYLLKPDYAFDFKRLGLRVPCVLISPWLDPGVCSDPLQHTSVLATVKKLFSLPSFLTHRDAQAGTFEHLFAARETPRTDAPDKLVRPSLPGSAQAKDEAGRLPHEQPPTPPQAELMHTLCHLDGHRDSGRADLPVPATQAALSDYVQERMQAHCAYHRKRAARSG